MNGNSAAYNAPYKSYIRMFGLRDTRKIDAVRGALATSSLLRWIKVHAINFAGFVALKSIVKLMTSDVCRPSLAPFIRSVQVKHAVY